MIVGLFTRLAKKTVDRVWIRVLFSCAPRVDLSFRFEVECITLRYFLMKEGIALRCGRLCGCLQLAGPEGALQMYFSAQLSVGCVQRRFVEIGSFPGNSRRSFLSFRIRLARVGLHRKATLVGAKPGIASDVFDFFPK